MYLRAAKVGTVHPVYPSQDSDVRGYRASQNLNKPKIHKLQENVGTVTAAVSWLKKMRGQRVGIPEAWRIRISLCCGLWKIMETLCSEGMRAVRTAYLAGPATLTKTTIKSIWGVIIPC